MLPGSGAARTRDEAIRTAQSPPSSATALASHPACYTTSLLAGCSPKPFVFSPVSAYKGSTLAAPAECFPAKAAPLVLPLPSAVPPRIRPPRFAGGEMAIDHATPLGLKSRGAMVIDRLVVVVQLLCFLVLDWFQWRCWIECVLVACDRRAAASATTARRTSGGRRG